MEKEIAWTAIAQNDFWEIVSYLKSDWPEKVLNRFEDMLHQKIALLKRHPISVSKAANTPVSEKPWSHGIIC